MEKQINITDNIANEILTQLFSFTKEALYKAISIALEAGHTPEWIVKTLKEWIDLKCLSESTDIMYYIYEILLQDARFEIETFTGYDFVCEATYIWTWERGMKTEYEYSKKSTKEIIEKLKQKHVFIWDLSSPTQWFLKQIGITSLL